jgi:hypothetical protein
MNGGYGAIVTEALIGNDRVTAQMSTHVPLILQENELILCV